MGAPIKKKVQLKRQPTKNKTKINYNLEKIANENTLKGLFAKNIKNKLNDETLTEEEKEIVEKAIEIAFDALE